MDFHQHYDTSITDFISLIRKDQADFFFLDLFYLSALVLWNSIKILLRLITGIFYVAGYTSN